MLTQHHTDLFVRVRFVRGLPCDDWEHIGNRRVHRLPQFLRQRLITAAKAQQFSKTHRQYSACKQQRWTQLNSTVFSCPEFHDFCILVFISNRVFTITCNEVDYVNTSAFLYTYYQTQGLNLKLPFAFFLLTAASQAPSGCWSRLSQVRGGNTPTGPPVTTSHLCFWPKSFTKHQPP